MKYRINQMSQQLMRIVSLVIVLLTVFSACQRSVSDGDRIPDTTSSHEQAAFVIRLKMNGAPLRGVTSTASQYTPALASRLNDNDAANVANATIFLTDNNGGIIWCQQLGAGDDLKKLLGVAPYTSKNITKDAGGYKMSVTDADSRDITVYEKITQAFVVLNAANQNEFKKFVYDVISHTPYFTKKSTINHNIKLLPHFHPSLSDDQVVYYATGHFKMVSPHEPWGVDPINAPNRELYAVKAVQMEAVTPMNRIQIIPKFFCIRRRVMTKQEFEKLFGTSKSKEEAKEKGYKDGITRYEFWSRYLPKFSNIEMLYQDYTQDELKDNFAKTDDYNKEISPPSKGLSGILYDKGDDSWNLKSGGKIPWSYLFYIDYIGDLGSAFMNRFFNDYDLIFGESSQRLYAHTYKERLNGSSWSVDMVGTTPKKVDCSSLLYHKDNSANPENGYDDGLVCYNGKYYTYINNELSNLKVFAFNYWAPGVTTYEATKDDDASLLTKQYAAPKIHLMFYGPDEETVFGDARCYKPYFINIVGYNFNNTYNTSKSKKIKTGREAGNQLITVDFSQYNGGLGWLLYSEDPKMSVSNKPETGKGGISPDITRTDFNIIPKAILNDLQIFRVTPQFDGPDD